MTNDEKIAAILAAVQIDPGNRGLARDPHDNLFTACPGDFAAACRSLSETTNASASMYTGFIIPTCKPPTHETDGPLGTLFLAYAFHHLAICSSIHAERQCIATIASAMAATQIDKKHWNATLDRLSIKSITGTFSMTTHNIAIERPGQGSDQRLRTMRGSDITALHLDYQHHFRPIDILPYGIPTIAIGDGGNEIGMGKIPHETIVKNIPNGDLIHCRVPADYLIVAGVSNWGAYALAAGVFVLRGEKPPSDLFDPDVEKRILEIMVREGPLVDGVTGEQTATVDGLTWNDYIQPMLKMREILEL
ncbi:DUF4392 domain-containing protein [soil metagenome]